MSKSPIMIDIGLSETERSSIAAGLSAFLADSYTLYLMTHNFHWNVKGPMFNTLHLMFMGQYTEQWNALDLIAERIRSLGHPAPGTYKEFVKLASIQEIDGVPKSAGNGAASGFGTRSNRTYRTSALSVGQSSQRSADCRFTHAKAGSP